MLLRKLTIPEFFETDMTDVFSTEKRSAIMSRVKNMNTADEVLVRRELHRLGYRFRLHGRDLPGKPDIVFRKRRKVIFVHGCFWHGHAECPRAKLPHSRREFWNAKIEANKTRDRGAVEQLETLGYSILTIWSCELRAKQGLSKRLVQFLGEIGNGTKVKEGKPRRP